MSYKYPTIMFNNARPTPEQRIAELERQLAAQAAHIEKYKTQPAQLATVLRIDGDYTIASQGAGIVRLHTPAEFLTRVPLSVGDTVAVSHEGIIVERIAPTGAGQPRRVQAVLDRGYEIAVGAEATHVVLKGCVVASVGDRILVDGSGTVAIASLGPAPSSMEVAPDVRVLWDDIGGQDVAKRKLREAIVDPIRHADVMREYGKAPCKGVLLHGPPGCGKTMLGKAAATALADLHGEAAGGSFIYVKGPEVVSKLVGETEANIRAVFARSRAYHKAHGHRCVVFIDEADAIMGQRTGADHTMGQLQRNAIAAFLTEMDGFADSGAIVILSTNRPGDLDSAVTRDGRIDEKVQVTRPTQADCEGIFRLNLRGKKLDGDLDMLVTSAAEFLFDDRHVVRDGRGIETVTLASIVSGALVAGIVQKATQRAITDAIAGNGRGISRAHLADATRETCAQNREAGR